MVSNSLLFGGWELDFLYENFTTMIIMILAIILIRWQKVTISLSLNIACCPQAGNCNSLGHLIYAVRPPVWFMTRIFTFQIAIKNLWQLSLGYSVMVWGWTRWIFCNKGKIFKKNCKNLDRKTCNTINILIQLNYSLQTIHWRPIAELEGYKRNYFATFGFVRLVMRMRNSWRKEW